MPFYDDDEKLTFDKAARLVDRFASDYAAARTRVRSKHVLRAYNEAETTHNRYRIVQELERHDAFECLSQAERDGKEFKLTNE